MNSRDSASAWLTDLFPHIRLSPYQIERLELIRTHAGLQSGEFHFHIKTHPECTKMLQRQLFAQIRQANPEMPEESALVLVIWTRFLTAQLTGEDLFGLARFPLVDPNDPPPEVIAAIVELLRSRGFATIEQVAQGIVDEEAALPSIPTSPDLWHVADQVTRILSEPSVASAATRSSRSRMGDKQRYEPETLGELLTAALGRTLLDGETPLAEYLFMRLQPDNPALFFRELFVFGLLPFDMALTVEAPPEAERARQSLHVATLRALNSRDSEGHLSLAAPEWATFVRTRFGEYLQNSLQPLVSASRPGPAYEKTGRQALYNLAGPNAIDDPDAIFRIQSHLALALPYALETIRGYREGTELIGYRAQVV